MGNDMAASATWEDNMQTFKVLSAFYIEDRNALMVAVEGRDERFRSGARIRDAFGRRFTIYALTSIGGISEENAARFTSFLINDCRDIGRLIQFDE